MAKHSTKEKHSHQRCHVSFDDKRQREAHLID